MDPLFYLRTDTKEKDMSFLTTIDVTPLMDDDGGTRIKGIHTKLYKKIGETILELQQEGVVEDVVLYSISKLKIEDDVSREYVHSFFEGVKLLGIVYENDDRKSSVLDNGKQYNGIFIISDTGFSKSIKDDQPYKVSCIYTFDEHGKITKEELHIKTQSESYLRLRKKMEEMQEKVLANIQGVLNNKRKLLFYVVIRYNEKNINISEANRPMIFTIRILQAREVFFLLATLLIFESI